MTLQQAMTCNEFHYGNCEKKVTKVRRSGKTQCWLRSPERFRIPVKYGLYKSYAITDQNMTEWHCEEDCPVKEKK